MTAKKQNLNDIFLVDFHEAFLYYFITCLTSFYCYDFQNIYIMGLLTYKSTIYIILTFQSCQAIAIIITEFISEMLYTDFASEYHGDFISIHIQCIDVSSCQLIQILHL